MAYLIDTYEIDEWLVIRTWLVVTGTEVPNTLPSREFRLS